MSAQDEYRQYAGECIEFAIELLKSSRSEPMANRR
jgi:hypothetical protein